MHPLPSSDAVVPAVLVAPDSFKGTWSAAQVAGFMAAGAHEAGWQSISVPLADGGEGTLDAVVSAQRLEARQVTAHDPFGEEIECRLLLGDGMAYVEAAEAVGLALVRRLDARSAVTASSRGVGELINHALAAGARQIMVGVGGSATSDGGAGLIEALDLGRWSDRVHVEVLTDSATSYEEAAQVFARQKGADETGVLRLTQGLHDQAGKLPRDPRGVPATGCGGGMSGALWAHGATLSSGADRVMDLLGIDDKIASADLVMTGEGCLDAQTLTGKLVARLAQHVARRHRPLVVIAGRVELTAGQCTRLGAAEVKEAGSPETITGAARELCESCPLI